jgi:hypothetical protein
MAFPTARSAFVAGTGIVSPLGLGEPGSSATSLFASAVPVGPVSLDSSRDSGMNLSNRPSPPPAPPVAETHHACDASGCYRTSKAPSLPSYYEDTYGTLIAAQQSKVNRSAAPIHHAPTAKSRELDRAAHLPPSSRPQRKTPIQDL